MYTASTWSLFGCLNFTPYVLSYFQVHIEFTDGQDKITVEGPPEEVDLAVKALESVVKDLVSVTT